MASFFDSDDFRQLFGNLSLRTKLMVTTVPSVVLILAVTGYVTYWVSNSFIETALERNVRIQNMATANAVSDQLEECRRDLQLIAQDPPSAASLRGFLAKRQALGSLPYLELAYLPVDQEPPLFFLVRDAEILSVPPERLQGVRPSPMLVVEKAAGLAPGETWISPVSVCEYSVPGPNGSNQRTAAPVIRMVTPCRQDGRTTGYLLLSLDARILRNLLSLYNSSQSPLAAFPRSGELRYSYLFDTEGWILFQSGEVEEERADLATYLARSGYDGTLGRANLAMAFRPNEVFRVFWSMVEEVHAGRSGGLIEEDSNGQSLYLRRYFLAYAPVTFLQNPDKPAQVYGGVAYIDRSKLTLAAGYKHLDVMFLITLAATVALVALVFLLARILTTPLLRLAKTVDAMETEEGLKEIDLPASGYEANQIKTAINKMIGTVRRQMEEIRIRDETIESQSLSQRATEEDVTAGLAKGPANPIPEIIGQGQRLDELRSDILKAARVDVDVLILGETGTGKQLAAEAIHRLSARAGKPFISINCGALDENLLLDTLFGHVKGAFTDSKTDRKGAFLEANGGTLFLDEIQSASPKVQQALLRAVAMRKIKPLGSDNEIDVDVRLVAATNADLTELIERRLFREDLYFRLKVITLRTPSLREHKDSIPMLALSYLRQAEKLVSKEGLALSRGALEKMKAYAWPGNVRELVNCITRAAVMAEGDLIRADDIRLEEEGGTWTAPTAEPSPRPSAPRGGSWSLPGADSRRVESGRGPARPAESLDVFLPEGVRLTPRQARALPLLVERGEVTRNDYQEIVGGDLPSRTAIYDLQDLVKKGVLRKEGRGPATRYTLIRQKT